MNRPVDDGQAAGKIFPPVVFIVAVLMIVFGVAEVVTGFTHQFFGLATAQVSLATVLGVALGFFYLAGGVLLLTQKKTGSHPRRHPAVWRRIGKDCAGDLRPLSARFLPPDIRDRRGYGHRRCLCDLYRLEAKILPVNPPGPTDPHSKRSKKQLSGRISAYNRAHPARIRPDR